MIETFEQYSLAANRTISGASANTEEFIAQLRLIPNASLLLTAALGLTGEGGEFADHVKKLCFHGQRLTFERRTKMLKELGDILWYANVASKALEEPLIVIADGNIQKLLERHPNGFDPAYHDKSNILPR